MAGFSFVFVGNNITLTCHCNGQPYPDFSWNFRKKNLQTTHRFKMDKNQLHILNVTIEDKGKYTCFATNSFGVISSSTTVTVAGIVYYFKALAQGFILHFNLLYYFRLIILPSHFLLKFVSNILHVVFSDAWLFHID